MFGTIKKKFTKILENGKFLILYKSSKHFRKNVRKILEELEKKLLP